MKRNLLSWLAFAALMVLTVVTWALADGSPWLLAGVALVKIAVIGAVFLELLRAWPVWGGIFVFGVLAVVLGAAAMITS